jgi:hypothetical protein
MNSSETRGTLRVADREFLEPSALETEGQKATAWHRLRVGEISRILLLLLILPLVAQAQFEYAVESGTVTISKYTGPGGAVIIPDTINGLPVTSIGAEAFKYFTSLTCVTIPDSVTSIGYDAFYGCTGLIGITIPDSITSIGNRAFAGCTGLTSITIPDSVTSIGEWAFYWCTGLNSIDVHASNMTYSSVDGVLFNKSQTTLIQYPSGKSVELTVAQTIASCTVGSVDLGRTGGR